MIIPGMVGSTLWVPMRDIQDNSSEYDVLESRWLLCPGTQRQRVRGVRKPC